MNIGIHQPLTLTAPQQVALEKMLHALIDQHNAHVIVPAQKASTGYWFGGGNVIQTNDGTLWLSGRYRNYGDSRTGLGVGERGLECAIFKSTNHGQTFEKTLSFSKADLSHHGEEVISIEGTALHLMPDGRIELFISMEKARSYPQDLASYQKPGTGVWVIDRLVADTVEQLSPTQRETILENTTHPEYLHVKDPFIFDMANGDTVLGFCTHPFTWSSSNTGLTIRQQGNAHFNPPYWEVTKRGTTWDVAATRVTNRMKLPGLGVFADAPDNYVYFYDGAECMRRLDENANAHSRPRGYSCEELGGVLIGGEMLNASLLRLSRLQPLFVSPYGTGTSRYVSTLITNDGIFATWQQSQPDESQPLVAHFLPMSDVEKILQDTTT